MKRSHKVTSWIAGGLLAVLAIAFVVIATFNWNRLKPTLDSRISQAIGRPFVIHGDLSVAWRRDPAASGLASLLPWPQFTAREVSIGNPAWAAKPDFARLDALRFRLSPWPLLTHRIVVPSLQLVHPQVDLQRDRQGRANWDFTLPPGGVSAWKLQLGSIGFDRGQLSLDDARRNIRLQMTITPLQQAIPYDQIVAQQAAAASAQADRIAGTAAAKAVADRDDHRGAAQVAASATRYQFAWQAEGSYQGKPLKGSGKTGAALALRSDTQLFPLQADVRIGDTHIALVGTLTDPLQLDALNVRLWLSGPSMALLYPILGITLPDTPPYATTGQLSAQLHRHGSHFSYRHFRGRVGGSDLAGSLDYQAASGSGSRPRLSGKVSSKLLQFADLAPLIGAGPAQAKPAADAPAQPAGKVLPATPFRTDRWRAMDADVQFTGAHIVHGSSLPIDALVTHLVMNNGVLRLDPLHFDLASGTVSGALTLDGTQSPMRGVLRLDARHLKLKQLFPGFAPMRTSFGEINGDASLDARGNSVAALLGSADGELKLLMNDGAISKNLLETAGLNVGNIIIGKLFGDQTVQINCAAADMPAKHGLFDMRLFVFDTADAVINVTGTVNLATEQLNLDVEPHTKGLRIFSLRSPLYVTGTLGKPDVGVQKGPLLLRAAGAVALGVVAAPAAALLALVAPSHDSDGKNTCRNVLEQLRSSGKAMPATQAATAVKPRAKKPAPAGVQKRH